MCWKELLFRLTTLHDIQENTSLVHTSLPNYFSIIRKGLLSQNLQHQQMKHHFIIAEKSLIKRHYTLNS